MLEPLITSNPRIHSVKVFINAISTGHLHVLTEVMIQFTKVFHKELNFLYEAGYLKKIALQKSFSSKSNYPVFTTLQKNDFTTFLTRCQRYNAFGAYRTLIKFVVRGNYVNRNDGGIIETVVVLKPKNYRLIMGLLGFMLNVPQ